MIQKLRLKFIFINMAIVTIMLCVIFGLVFHFTSLNLEEESAGLLQAVAMEPVQMGPPGRGSQVRLPYFSIQVTMDGELIPSGNNAYTLLVANAADTNWTATGVANRVKAEGTTKSLEITADNTKNVADNVFELTFEGVQGGAAVLDLHAGKL